MSDWVYIEVQVVRQETDKAFQVVANGSKIWWIPKSQVADADDYEAGDRDFTMAITEWIAKEKGIES